ncbi:MAG: Nif11-like leader peptide family RiPP precursor [Oscillospiraceae bacterium]|nr:Nif11-like leader peptide family RiPP precursor [Oscillospiraceae bacterium]
MENKFTPELIAKARQAKSPEELLALAKENGIEIAENEARDYFAQMNKSGELSDDELDNVSGGGCYYGDGRLVVTAGYYCKRYKCKKCGIEFSPGFLDMHLCQYRNEEAFYNTVCNTCKYKTGKGMRMLCNHPDNYKK